MSRLFMRLRDRPFAMRAGYLFVYGLLTFIAIYYIGNLFFDNFVFFRVFEFIWFVHIVIIANQMQRSQRELIVLALLGLAPGIVNNLLSVFALQGWG